MKAKRGKAGGVGRAGRILLAVLLILLVCGWSPAVHAASHPRVLGEWREPVTGVHPAFLSVTPGGGLLVVRNGYLGPSVVELDAAGAKVWEYGPVQATAAVRLDNGHTLICDSGAPGPPRVPRVIEVTPQGAIVWQYRTKNRAEAPQFALRLSGGRTLVTLPDRVVEVDSRGRLLWASKAAFRRAAQAVRLASGHTLVVERGLGGGGRVVELDGKGLPVWQYPGKAGQLPLLEPVAAYREGDVTRICDVGAARLLSVDRAGTVVDVLSWEEVRLGLPLGNQWWITPAPDGTLFLSASYTNGRGTVLHLNDRAVRLYLDGKLTLLDLPPLLEQEEVLVPVRPLVAALGGGLAWDAATGRAVVQGVRGTLVYAAGVREVLVDGRPEPLPAAPRLLGGSLFVPYARLAESLGATARWEEKTLTLYLTRPAPAPPSPDGEAGF
ncbi:MAG: copper amine oxidase N-terminal domain-containing protein [Clostridia bacterium]|nr:copper amine oxidase N-terminal domain-containing protein [Clostridia bacterium]